MIKRRINTQDHRKQIRKRIRVLKKASLILMSWLLGAKISISINEASEEAILVVNELKEVYDLGEKAEGIIFKKVDFKRLNTADRRVNNVLTETNNLIVSSYVWVSRQLGLKKAKRDGKTKSEPWCKHRIEDSIN